MRNLRANLPLIAATFATATSLAMAAETVSVAGSSARFATSVEAQVDNKPVRVNLTGAVLRKKGVFSVYTIASYLQDGAKAKNAEQLAGADAVKLLMLVMERDVSGRDMADAIQTGVRLNYPADAFPAEMKKVIETLGTLELRKGNHVYLTAIPGVGLRCQVIGKADVMIPSPKFARAIWDIYLGRNNLGDPIRMALISRL